MLQEWTTVNTTTSGELTSAGIPTRVKLLHIISDGTAGVTTISNNGSGGTVLIKVTGTINTGKTIYYGEDGYYFPKGAFLTPDAHSTNVTVVCRKCL